MTRDFRRRPEVDSLRESLQQRTAHCLMDCQLAYNKRQRARTTTVAACHRVVVMPRDASFYAMDSGSSNSSHESSTRSRRRQAAKTRKQDQACRVMPKDSSSSPQVYARITNKNATAMNRIMAKDSEFAFQRPKNKRKRKNDRQKIILPKDENEKPATVKTRLMRGFHLVMEASATSIRYHSKRAARQA